LAAITAAAKVSSLPMERFIEHAAVDGTSMELRGVMNRPT